MRSSSNPAFRNLPSGGSGGYATFDRQGGGAMSGAAAYADTQTSQVEYGRAAGGERPITIDDVVMKTGLSAGTALVLGTLTAVSGLYGLALPAFIVGFVVSLVLIFKPKFAGAPLVLLYSAAMGVALGGISGIFNDIYPGIALQAIVGTAGVFLGMLVVYKTGAIRVTPRFTKWLMGALIGFFPVVINTAVGLSQVEPDMLDLGRVFNAPKWKIFVKIRIPNALPYILSALKITATAAVVGAIVGEFVASQRGLGYVIVTTQSSMNTSVAFAALVWISVVGLLLYGAVVLLAHLWAPWAEGVD